MKSTFALILGLIFTFAILESSIRIAGHLSQNKQFQRVTPFNSTAYRILCIGNSHTAGSGVEWYQAYPAVLERKLNNAFPQMHFRVINGGLGNANTSVLLDALPDQIEKIKPHLVIIMAGEPNVWSWYGFSRYKKAKNKNLNIFKIDYLFHYPGVLLENLRIFRLLEVIFKKEKVITEYSQYNELERVMYWRASLEIPFIPLSKDDANTKRNDLENYIHHNDLKKAPNGRDFYIALYRLYRDSFHDWEKTVEIMKQSIELKDDFDAITYNDISQALDGKNNNIQRQLLELKKEDKAKGYPGDLIYKTIMSVFPFGDLSKLSTEQLVLAHQMLPGSSNIYADLITRLSGERKITEQEQVKAYREALEMYGPSSMRNDTFLESLKSIMAETHNRNLQSEIHDFLKRFQLSYPNLADSINSIDYVVPVDWISFDLNKIVDLLQGHKINILIQNYHWLRGNPHELILDDVLKNVAAQRKIPFSDTHQYFLNYIKESGKNANDFLSTKYGAIDNHPSVLGHQVIAEKLLADIVKFKLLSH